jgi:hypothetical protein
VRVLVACLRGCLGGDCLGGGENMEGAIMEPNGHIEVQVTPCPKHGVLEFKVDQTYIKIEIMEKDIKAILSVLTALDSHRLLLESAKTNIDNHSDTLFGEDRQSGLVSDVRTLREERNFRNRVAVALVGFVFANLAFIWSVVRKLI